MIKHVGLLRPVTLAHRLSSVCTFLASSTRLPAAAPRLGVSVGEAAVALVELLPRRHAMAVARAGVEPRRRGEPDAHPALSRLLERLAPASRRVVTALNADRLLEQRIELPAGLSLGELERHLEARLTRLAATLDEPPLFDFCLANDLDSNAVVPQRLAWRLVACRASELRAREEEFAGLGVEIVAVEVDRFALSRLVAHTPVDALLYRDGERLWLLRDDAWSTAEPAVLDCGPALVDWLRSVWGEVAPLRLWLAGDGWRAAAAAELSEALGRRVAAYQPGSIGVAPADPRLALAYGLGLRGLTWRGYR